MEIVDNNDMKIIRNKITSSFFKRCRNNIQNDAINNCLGLVIRKEDEDFIRKELRRIGDYEFQSPKASWPSLYIDTDEFIKTPYNANIHLDRITDDQFEYSYDYTLERYFHVVDIAHMAFYQKSLFLLSVLH